MSRRALVGSVLPCACALALGACGSFISSFRPNVPGPRGTSPTSDALGIGGVAPGRDTTFFGRPRERARSTRNAGGALAQRRQCRGAGIPTGWIAVAYENASDACPGRPAAGSDSVATVAVIVRYGTAPIGTRLDVCADQPTPSGWSWVTDEGPGDPGACPQAAPRGQSTVQRIRRDF